MSDFLTSGLPSYYRLDLSERLLTAIRQGKSINLIGMPAVGKFTYLNFFLFNQQRFFLDDTKRNFVIINCREFRGDTLNDVKKFLAHELALFTGLDSVPEEKQIDEFFRRMSLNSEIYLILRFFDELPSKILPEILKYFLVLRQKPYAFRFLFISNRPLSEVVEDKVVLSRLLSGEEFFTPSSYKDFEYEVKAYETFLGLSYSPAEIEKLYKITGGHGGYLKYIMSTENEMRLKYLESDTYKKIVEEKKLTNSLIRRSEEIVRMFTEEEADIIVRASQDKLTEKDIPEFMLNLGVIKKEEGKFEPFSEILDIFLESH